MQVFNVINLTNEQQDVFVRVLDPCGPFRLGTAPHTLNAGETGKVVVAFAPDHPGDFYDEVLVSSGPTRLRCHVHGSATAPRLVVADSEGRELSDRVNAGPCAVGDVVSRVLKLTNPNTFPVAFEFALSSNVVDGRTPRATPVDPSFVAAERNDRGRVAVRVHPVSVRRIFVSCEIVVFDVYGTTRATR